MSLDDKFTRRTALGLTGGLALSAILTPVGVNALERGRTDDSESRDQSGSDVESVRLERIGRYKTGQFDGGAEDVSYYPDGQRLFVADVATGKIRVVDISDPAAPKQERVLDASDAFGAAATTTSLDISDGLVAVVATNTDQQSSGRVIFYDAASLEPMAVVEVGVLPDMVTYTPDGNFVLVANVGAASNSESVDPRGSVSVIDVRDGVENAAVSTASFEAFDGMEDELREEGVRIYGQGADADPVASRDLAPAYIAPTADSTEAFVCLQVNNALAKLDVTNAEITDIIGLGTKDFGLLGNELDTSTVDGPSLQNWPLRGFYQPDGIATYTVDGEPYVLTANEGASRAFEETTVADLSLDPKGFHLTEYPAVDTAADLKKKANLGQLTVTNQQGDPDSDGKYESLYAFGARSFSIWDGSGQLLFDSGNDFERIAATRYPKGFVQTDLTKSGPQPETVITGQVGDRTFAFIALERFSSVFVYDVTNPERPEFVQVLVNRDFDVTFGDLSENPSNPGRGGDFSPEGLEFIAGEDCPTDTPLLVASYAVSGTVAVFEVTALPESE
jgi:DNA-binding beta-propeller fold protein YncE